jgi:hypothetical protein
MRSAIRTGFSTLPSASSRARKYGLEETMSAVSMSAEDGVPLPRAGTL